MLGVLLATAGVDYPSQGKRMADESRERESQLRETIQAFYDTKIGVTVIRVLLSSFFLCVS